MVSKKEKAIGLLEELFRDILYGCLDEKFSNRANKILDLLHEEPEPSEYERLLDKHIEAVKHIHRLWEDLDAECRVSQMLLAEQKKLQAELKAKDELLFAYESVRAPKKEKQNG